MTTDSGSWTPAVIYEGEDGYYADKLPPGVIFAPTDEELITQFLTNKFLGEDLPWLHLIDDVGLSEYHPEDLAEKYMSSEKEGHWYFFTSRKRKYTNGMRPSRTAAEGFWKATLVDKPIKIREKVIGTKKTLKFVEGRQKDKSSQRPTCWLMQEYRIPQFKKPVEHQTQILDDYVLCKIYRNRLNDARNQSDGVHANGATNELDGSQPKNKRHKSSNLNPSPNLMQQQPQQSDQILSGDLLLPEQIPLPQSQSPASLAPQPHDHQIIDNADQFTFQSNSVNDANTTNDFLFSNDSGSGYLSSIIPESYLRKHSPPSQDKFMMSSNSQVQYSYDSSSTNYSYSSASNGDLWAGYGAEICGMSSNTSPYLTEMHSGGVWIDEPLWEGSTNEFPIDGSMDNLSTSACCSLPQVSDTYSTSVSSLAEGFDFSEYMLL